MRIVGHRVQAARFVASPHCDARPADTAIDLVVVHGISLPPGRFGTGWVQALFTGRLDRSASTDRAMADPAHRELRELEGVRVSSHLLIGRDGALTQFVPFHQRAWHAGVSSWDGREGCNDFSIGIELEGTDEIPYTDAQYAALARLLRALLKAYPALSAERIVGHCDVAPGRKTDPGPVFDWARLHRAVGAGASSSVSPGGA